MALINLLSIARSALASHQAATEATAHNIANASTEGYTRQRVTLSPEIPQPTAYGLLGRGVQLESFQRVRDDHLDRRFREESALAGRFTSLHGHLSELESIFGEPSDSGLGQTLDAFWAAWGNLSNDPSGGAARVQVQSQAQQVVRAFRGIDERVARVSDNAATQVDEAIATVNRLARDIGDLNQQITTAETGSRSANDLRDRRDLLLDELAEIVPTRVLELDDGSASVIVGDTLLVDHELAQQLEARTTPGLGLAVGVRGSAGTFNLQSGQIAAHLEVANGELPRLRGQVDELVAALVTEVNAIHRTGITATGANGVDFFEAGGLTADSIRLSRTVEFSIDEIAAGVTGLPGDNSLALALSGLRSAGLATLGGVSLNERLTQTLSELGTNVRQADQQAASQDTLVSNVDAQRESVHGVSVDEEMVALITHQQAYAAAARMVSVADEMLDEILRMV